MIWYQIIEMCFERDVVVLTTLHKPEVIAHYILDIISEVSGYDVEYIIRLIFYQKNEKWNMVFWEALDYAYPDHPFKELYYCGESGLCEVR